jgi:hypothetical protein
VPIVDVGGDGMPDPLRFVSVEVEIYKALAIGWRGVHLGLLV